MTLSVLTRALHGPWGHSLSRAASAERLLTLTEAHGERKAEGEGFELSSDPNGPTTFETCLSGCIHARSSRGRLQHGCACARATLVAQTVLQVPERGRARRGAVADPNRCLARCGVGLRRLRRRSLQPGRGLPRRVHHLR